jgi:hypothetical protein
MSSSHRNVVVAALLLLLSSAVSATNIKFTPGSDTSSKAHTAPRSQKYWNDNNIERPDYGKTDAEVFMESWSGQQVARIGSYFEGVPASVWYFTIMALAMGVVYYRHTRATSSSASVGSVESPIPANESAYDKAIREMRERETRAARLARFGETGTTTPSTPSAAAAAAPTEKPEEVGLGVSLSIPPSISIKSVIKVLEMKIIYAPIFLPVDDVSSNDMTDPQGIPYIERTMTFKPTGEMVCERIYKYDGGKEIAFRDEMAIDECEIVNKIQPMPHGGGAFELVFYKRKIHPSGSKQAEVRVHWNAPSKMAYEGIRTIIENAGAVDRSPPEPEEEDPEEQWK